MPQYPKEQIHQNLLDAARESFLEFGYAHSTMRLISGRAGVSLGNTYNYFSNKDALFQATIAPTLAYLEALPEQMAHLSVETAAYHLMTRRGRQALFAATLTFLTERREDLRLLAFSAQGSSLSDFLNTTLEAFVSASVDTHKRLAEAYPEQIRRTPSATLLRCVYCFYMHSAMVLIREDLSPAQLRSATEELLYFVHNGYRAFVSDLSDEAAGALAP